MRQTILIGIALAVLLPSIATAAWTDDFLSDYENFGIDTAVAIALDNAVTVQEILEFVVSDPVTFNETVVLVALYCAHADPDEIASAALAVGISQATIDIAHEEAVAEDCIVPVELQSFVIE